MGLKVVPPALVVVRFFLLLFFSFLHLSCSCRAQKLAESRCLVILFEGHPPGLVVF